MSRRQPTSEERDRNRRMTNVFANAKPGENLTDKLDAAIHGRCLHEDFDCSVVVNRVEDKKAFVADVRVKCHQCGLPFEFVGLAAGLSFYQPRCDVSAQEAHLPIKPKGSKIMPGIPGYEVKAQ